MAEQQLPDINVQINELPFDKEVKNKLFYAFYDENPRKAFESIKGVPLNIKQAMFDIRGKIYRGEQYDVDDIVRAVPVEQRKPPASATGKVIGTEKIGAIPPIKLKVPKPEEIEKSETPAAKKELVGAPKVEAPTRPAVPTAQPSAEEKKTTPLPVEAKAESKQPEPTKPLVSREEMESRFVNYNREQLEKAEKSLREKKGGQQAKQQSPTAKKFQGIQIQAEETAPPPAAVIVLNPYKPGTPEYEAERKRSARTPVAVEEGPAQSGKEGLGRAIEYTVEQVPKAAKALSRVSNISTEAEQAGRLKPLSEKQLSVLSEDIKTLREPVVRPELLVPGGDGRKDLTRELVRGGLEGVGELTSPETAAIIASTKGLDRLAVASAGVTKASLNAAASALSAVFTSQVGLAAYEKGKEALDLYKKGDYTGAANRLGLASVDALFALMGAVHGAKEGAAGVKSFKEGYATGQRRRAVLETEIESKIREDFEPVPGEPGMWRVKKKPESAAPVETPISEPKGATAKERSVIDLYKEDPEGTYNSITEKIDRLTKEIDKLAKYGKKPTRNKENELKKLNSQKALLDKYKAGEKTTPVATEPVTEQPVTAAPAEPPPVAEEAPVVEPPPIVEPTPPTAEPVKAAVEPTVKPTVAETFSTPGGAKITDITQTSPEGFTPGIDYIPETDFIFDVEGIGKFTVIPSSEKPGSFAIWPEGDTAPAAVVEGTNAKEAFTSFIDKPAPEVKVEAPVTPTGATEAPPASGVTAPTAKPPTEGVKAVTEPPPVKKEPAKPLWEMNIDELEKLDKDLAQDEQNTLVELFGEEGAKKYKQLERSSNSWDHNKADRASAQMAQMEDSLTEEQRNKLYGGHLEYAPEDVRDYIDSINGLDFSSEKNLGRSIRTALTSVGQAKTPNEMTSTKEQVAWATIKQAMEGASEKGFDLKEVINQALKSAWDRFADPEDAEFMLRRFIKKEVEARRQPISTATPTKALSTSPPPVAEAPKPPVESPKAATEPPQEYIPGTDGEVYVWMDYIGSDGKLSRKPVFLSSSEKSKVWVSLLQHFGRLIDKERKLPESMRIYFTGGILPGGKLAKPNRNTPYTDINTSYVEDLVKAIGRNKGEPNYQERVDNAIQKLQSLFDVPATVPAEKPKGGTGKKTKKGEAPVHESPVEPAPSQPQPPVELTPKPPVAPSEPGGGPVAVKERTPKQVEPSEKEIQQEEKALEFYPLDELPKKTAKMSSYFGDATSNKTRTVTVYNGETWHTDGRALVKGEHPGYWKEGTINNQPSLNLKGIVPDEYTKTEPVQPIAYKHWLREEDGARKRKIQDEAIIMSDGGSISGEYYRYVKNKVNPDEWKVLDKDRYVAYKDGKPVAVVMGLRGVAYNKESVSMSLRERKNVRQKEIWEMSTSELLKRQKANNSNPDYREAIAKNDTHDKIVAEAVLSGKPVPEYVVEGMGAGFRWVSDSIADKLYPEKSKEEGYRFYSGFEEKVKPIVLDYLERVREGENPGDIYEFVKSKLEPGPNPPGFTPAPPELPKPKDKQSATESKEQPAKPSGKIAVGDIEEVSRTPEGEIELAYGKKRYQAVPAFDGKGYRFYDMDSGKKIGEFVRSQYLKDAPEALAEILSSAPSLTSPTSPPSAALVPPPTEVTPVESPKIQTKYIEPKTPQYRKGGYLMALKLKTDRNPVIWMNTKASSRIARLITSNGISGMSKNKVMGRNYAEMKELQSALNQIINETYRPFKGSDSDYDFLKEFQKQVEEASRHSKTGSLSVVNVDSPQRKVTVLPSAYQAIKGLVKGKKETPVGTVGDLIRTFRHEGVHAEITTVIGKIPKSVVDSISETSGMKKVVESLRRKGYKNAASDPYLAINEFMAHYLSGDKEYFKANGMTGEDLVNIYASVRKYILAIDEEAIGRAERFRKPGVEVSEEISDENELKSGDKSIDISEDKGRKTSPIPSSISYTEQVDYSQKKQKTQPAAIEFPSSTPFSEINNREIPTRIPESAKSTENAIDNLLTVGLNAIAIDPKMLTTLVDGMRRSKGSSEYVGLSGIKLSKDPLKAASQIIDRMTDNLLWLYDNMPEDMRDRARLWYEGANKIARSLASEYGLPEDSVAGIMAVLSPQKDWYQNVELAKRVIQTYTNRSTLNWEPEMDRFIQEAISSAKPESKGNFFEAVEKIKGKPFSEAETDYEKAIWLRAHDEAFSNKQFRTILPEGDFSEIKRNKDKNKTPSQYVWQPYETIAKAISIIENGSRENISEKLGKKHKVRNFYNNILFPNSKSGHVTIDTHAVGSALLQPVGSEDIEVVHNFNGPKSSLSGMVGSYGLIADAFRKAAELRGINPREMQSVTWEAARMLFTDKSKSVKDAVKQAWLKMEKDPSGDINKIREEIKSILGGFSAPDWHGKIASKGK